MNILFSSTEQSSLFAYLKINKYKLVFLIYYSNKLVTHHPQDDRGNPKLPFTRDKKINRKNKIIK